jgi:stress response protein YsnF
MLLPAKYFMQEKKNSTRKISADRKVLSVIEETAEVTTKVVDKAKVVVSKTIDKHVEYFDIPVTEEQVIVKRIPKNEFVEQLPPHVRNEGDVMIISVLKEVPVIEKRMMLVEEIHVTKINTVRTKTREVVLNKERVTVKRTELLPEKKSK